VGCPNTDDDDEDDEDAEEEEGGFQGDAADGAADGSDVEGRPRRPHSNGFRSSRRRSIDPSLPKSIGVGAFPLELAVVDAVALGKGRWMRRRMRRTRKPKPRSPMRTALRKRHLQTFPILFYSIYSFMSSLLP
jgi:hypothetical protein